MRKTAKINFGIIIIIIIIMFVYLIDDITRNLQSTSAMQGSTTLCTEGFKVS